MIEEAEPPLRDALEASRVSRGIVYCSPIVSLNHLGLPLKNQGRIEEAEPPLQEALEASRVSLGVLYPSTLVSLNHLGLPLKDAGLSPAERDHLLRRHQPFVEMRLRDCRQT